MTQTHLKSKHQPIFMNWTNGLHSLVWGVIALAKTQYGKTITSAELKACVTVEDVFNLIKNK